MEETQNNTNVIPVPVSQPQPILDMSMNIVNGGVISTAPTQEPASTTTTTTPDGRGSLELFGDGKIKKKRGRPRKYDSDGNLNIKYLNPTPTPSSLPLQGFSFSPTSPTFSSSKFPNSKKGRGNPIYAQHIASYGGALAITAGGDFMPHVVTVHTGEDVSGKILSFSQKTPRGICVLSANGAISNVTLRQSCSSGGLLTYEGRFEILCLSGSYIASDQNGMSSRTGGLSVSLAGPDGRVIGGGVAGLLIAASPIQLVLGSFIPNGHKALKRKYKRVNSVTSPNTETVTAARPISQANPETENFLMQKSQLPSHEQSQREPFVVGVDNVTSEKLNLDASLNDADNDDAATWNNGSEEFSDQRISPDINVSLPDE